MRTGLHTAEPYYHEDSSTALESTGRHASALRVTAGRFSSQRDCGDRSTTQRFCRIRCAGLGFSR